jgi:predicted nucleic acid-binding protein
MVVERVRFFQTQFRVAEDNAQVTEKLLSLMQQIAIGGKQVHDANIVATMQAYGIDQLLTHNVADFARFSAHITLLPLIPSP